MSTVNINIKYLIKKIEVKTENDFKDIQARVTESVMHAVSFGAMLSVDNKNSEKNLEETIKEGILKSVVESAHP